MEAIKSHSSEAEVRGETTIAVQWDGGSFPSARMLAAETVIIALSSWYYRTFTVQKKYLVGLADGVSPHHRNWLIFSECQLESQ